MFVPHYLSNTKFINNDIRRFGSYLGPPTTSPRSPEPKDQLAILFPVSTFYLKAFFCFENNVLRGEAYNFTIFLRSQMISEEDYNFISNFDGADASTRMSLIQANPHQLPKTFMNLLSQISKDATIQYLLTLLDDLLQEDKSRVEIFKTFYANRAVSSIEFTEDNNHLYFIKDMFMSCDLP